MRVVFDTNIFISAFLVPGGQAERAFLMGRRRRFTLFTSVPILTETAEKLREKFDQTPDDITVALKLISRAAQVLRPPAHLHVVSDEADNRILECALAARADLVVTGDKHLLRLARFRDVTMSDLRTSCGCSPPRTRRRAELGLNRPAARAR